MKWLKYTLLTTISACTGKSVVNLLGSTYVVGNKFVRKIR